MFTYKNATEAFPDLLHRVLVDGHIIDSRNGQTKELGMVQIQLTDPVPAEITTPGRRVALPAQIAEVMWLLAGRNDIEWLSNYLPRAKDFSDDGKTWRGAYGPRIRKWAATAPSGRPWDGRNDIDQLEHVIDLLKDDPGTRRAVVSIYNPEIDTLPGKDIPCNDFLHFISRDGKLNLNVFTRSNDLMWGWSGINSFEWSILLQIVAGLTGMETGSVTFNISSLHLYEKHWGRAMTILDGLKAEDVYAVGFETPVRPATSDFFANPMFNARVAEDLAGLDKLVEKWFHLEGMIRSNPESQQLAYEIHRFPEPMMRSWLRVLYAWWHGDIRRLLAPLEGTSLYAAALASPKRKVAAPPVPVPPEWWQPEFVQPALVAEGFVNFVSKLHEEKHAAYGDSWKRRGEMLGIMANIARKVDRLGVAGGGDTSADTAIDLLVYLIKYRLYLSNEAAVDTDDHPLHVSLALTAHGERDEKSEVGTEALIKILKDDFDALEPLVMDSHPDRIHHVARMINFAHPLALRLWAEELDAEMLKEGILPNKVVVGTVETVQGLGNTDNNDTRRFNGYATTEDSK